MSGGMPPFGGPQVVSWPDGKVPQVMVVESMCKVIGFFKKGV